MMNGEFQNQNTKKKNREFKNQNKKKNSISLT